MLRTPTKAKAGELIKYYSMKKLAFLISLITFTFQSCTQSFGPGYEFELFKNTPNWELAKAVKSEDEDAINSILKDKNININLQEPTFGGTILMLAVGNEKLKSARLLLENGANQNIKDIYGNAAIHEATKSISLKKYAPEMLELLLKFGADPNNISIVINGQDSSSSYLPLMGAIEDIESTKILLNYGANLYYSRNERYPIWENLLIQNSPDEITVAKYLIIDKKMRVPNPILFTIPDHSPIDIIMLLNRLDFSGDSHRLKIKEEILNYLKEINFPQNGVFK